MEVSEEEMMELLDDQLTLKKIQVLFASRLEEHLLLAAILHLLLSQG